MRRGTPLLLLALCGVLAAAACAPVSEVVGTAGGAGAGAGSATGEQAASRPPPNGVGAASDRAAEGGATPEGRSIAGDTRPPWWVDPATSGQPWPGARVEGLLTFRGSPTRSWYGWGPVPRQPRVVWSYPAEGTMCGPSTVGGETSTWCGTGWTGQPAVWGHGGRTLVAFGAYDHALHVLDAATGRPALPRLVTGDLIKGSVTVDPDGYPLVYVGSRDGFLRVVALDRDEPAELWALGAYDHGPTLWNDDWDGSPMIVGGMLVQGGENSRFYVVDLNRGYDAAGRVTVAPRVRLSAPGWDDDLLAAVGDTNVSIESSVAISGTTAYFANSGGLVQGWDLAAVVAGAPPERARTFRYWMGDDVDATVVVDGEGALYVAAEYERGLARAGEVGQLVKLDPRRKGDPLVWSVPLRTGGLPSGVWATPALHEDVVIVATHAGEVVAVDRRSGQHRWTVQLPGPTWGSPVVVDPGVSDFITKIHDTPGPTWGSPVVVDGVLIQGDCAGVLHGFDVADTRAQPARLWSVTLGGCIESTPAVWEGRIYVGTRGGRFHALGDTPGGATS